MPAPSGGSLARPLSRLQPAGGLRPTDLLARFFPPAIAFLLAGAVAGILDTLGALGWWGHWLALHLALLGGVSQLVLGAGQFFATAFLATEPPGRRTVAVQQAAWSAGTVLVAVGVPTDQAALTDAGGAAIVAGLALFVAALRGLERRSLQTARWAIRWYVACALSLSVGAVLGVLLARGVAWSHGSLLGAHLSLNLAGWLGTAIVGTLHTFYPSLTQTTLPRPRLQGATFAAWMLGVTALAAGYAFDAAALIGLGLVALTFAAGLLVANVAGCARAAARPLALTAQLVGAGQAFLVAGLLLALAGLAAHGADAPMQGDRRDALAVLLLAGWVGLTVAGSLLHLLGVLGHVRRMQGAVPVLARRRGPLVPDGALTALAVASVAALALAQAPRLAWLATPAALALAAATLVLAARIVVLAARAVRATTPTVRRAPG